MSGKPLAIQWQRVEVLDAVDISPGQPGMGVYTLLGLDMDGRLWLGECDFIDGPRPKIVWHTIDQENGNA